MDKESKKIIQAIDDSLEGKEAELELKASIKAADFAHRNKVDVIIAPESQGRPNALFLRDVYVKRYPGEKVPTAVFINFNVVNSPAKLKDHFPRLVEELKKGKKAFILDACSHSGKTMEKASEVVSQVAKKKVLKGVINKKNIHVKARKFDFVGKFDPYNCSFFNRKNMGMMKSNESFSPYGKVMSESQKFSVENFEKRAGSELPIDYAKTRQRMKKIAEKTPVKRRRMR